MIPRTPLFQNPQAALFAALLLVSCCLLPVSAVTVTDDAGTIVTLNATPGRIVSLAPSNTEILAALGLTGRLVGITDVCNYPPEVNTVPRIGGYSSISTEKVSAARPDLVIASDITPAETTARLRALGLSCSSRGNVGCSVHHGHPVIVPMVMQVTAVQSSGGSRAGRGRLLYQRPHRRASANLCAGSTVTVPLAAISSARPFQSGNGWYSTPEIRVRRTWAAIKACSSSSNANSCGMT